MRIVYLLRKPTTEPTVATNALRWGTGALNIDAGRIAAPLETIATHSRSPEASAKENRPVYGEYGPLTTHQTDGQRLGRWPANLILQHRPACVREGVREVGSGDKRINENDEFHGGVHAGYARPNRSFYTHKISGQVRTYGTETVPAWRCAPECPVAALDVQSGVSKSTGGRIGNAKGVYTQLGSTGWSGTHEAGDPGFGDTGGASRFFRQVHPGAP
jgi:hypothetical protein